jgi:hypothetical protein
MNLEDQLDLDLSDGKTLLVITDLYPSEGAVDFGTTRAMPEAFEKFNKLNASKEISNCIL